MTENPQLQHSISTQQIKYLQKMKKNQESNKITSMQNIEKVLKDKEQSLKSQIQKGNMQIQKDPSILSRSYMLSRSRSSNGSEKQKQKQKQKKAFYISSDPEIIKKHYQRLQLLKQEYSHQNTTKVVKEVQNKIKGWIKRQKSSQFKRSKFVKQKQTQEKQQKQIKQKVKQKSIQQKKEQHKKELLQKMQQRTKKKQQLENLMKQQNISKKLLKNKTPLYIEKQKLYNQKLFEKQAISKFEMRENKKFSVSVNSEALKQHQHKYLESIKQIIEKRRKYSNKKLLTQQETNDPQFNHEFVTTKTDRQEIQLIEEHKKNRIKQYIERLRSMSPDITTLERIQKVKEQISMNQKKFQNSVNSKKNKNNGRFKKTYSSKNIKSKNDGEQIDRKKIGIEYLKENIEKIKKIKTENALSGRQKQTEEYVDSFVNQQAIRVNNQSSTKHFNNLINAKTKSSPSPQKSQQKSKPIKSNKLPSIQKKPQYKNYLVQLKLKPQKPVDKFDKIKRQLKYPTQIMRQFNRMSLEVQKKMMSKIKQFKNLQKSQKYEKNLQKELEIDQLYHKNLQLRLACLQLT